MPVRDQATRAINALRNVLPRQVSIRSGRKPGEVQINELTVNLAWIGDGWLPDARRLIDIDRARPTIAAARRVSPGAAKALSSAGIGFVDDTGAAEIVLPGLIVSRAGQAQQSPDRPGRWTRSVLAIAEALLCDVQPTVAAIREATNLSSGSCTNGLRFLTRERLLSAKAKRGRGSGRQMTDPDRLLNAYARAAAAVPLGDSLQVGVAWRDPIVGLRGIGDTWNDEGIEWAATGPLAAALIAPHLSSVSTAHVYVDAASTAGLAAAADVVGLRPIQGGRLRLTTFPTATARRCATVVEDVRLAPWPRIYADLRTAGVRGEEAAEHLREVMSGRTT